MIICAREGCEEKFAKKKHNQKYCCDECCRLATNSRIMEKYYEGVAQRQGKPRFCRACEMPLSRYNDTQVCSACKMKREVSANNAVVDMLRAASLTS